MNAGVVIVNAKLKREHSDIPWGFRMIGGSDQRDHPQFLLQKVTPGSLAAKAGLQPGDVVFIVNDQPLAGLTHSDACDVINSGEDDLKMRVKRIPKPKGGLGGQPGGNINNNSENEESKQDSEPNADKSSPSTIDQVAKGISQQAKLLIKGGQPSFVVEVTPDLTLSHTQVNTPLNMYSEESLEDTINNQLNSFISKNPKYEYLQA